MEEYIPYLIGAAVGIFLQYKYKLFEMLKEKM